MKLPSDPVIAAVARGTRETQLLRRICYWWRYATIMRGDKRWMTKTRAQWATETGLSEPQVKRAMARLRELGVIETEQHQWTQKGRGARCQGYVRLLPKAEALLGLSS